MVAGQFSPPELTASEILLDTPDNSPASTISLDSEYICLKVKDVLGVTMVDKAQKFVYCPDTTFTQLFNDVAERFVMAVGDFNLTYQDRMDLYELSDMPMDEKLTAANLFPSRQREYAISISTRSKKNRKQYMESIARNLESSFDANASDVDNIITDEPRKKEFVGLKNMTMTCYLNSLIQGLWFTPEFRNLIYSYCVTNDSGNKKKSISRPLQKIFLQLQFSTREAIETDQLTKTFGWTDRDTWQQHDIQELCSVLMEMLNTEFKSSPQDGMINGLYYGCLTDYVKCLECNNFRRKPEEFLVLPLPIRKPNRDPLDKPTLEEALRTFTAYELLEGNNQYRCERCEKPVDAHKGYLFKTLPSIFCVQLKRFDSDWETNRRYKLNDRIIFPVALDMNQFMDNSDSGDLSSDHCVNLDLLKPSVEANVPRTTHSRPGILLDEQSNDIDIDQDVADLGSSRDVVVKTLKQMKNEKGPNVFELFAVFIHRGGLAGGHYFAYIKDLETYRWYRCDDSSVRKAQVDDIRAAFGDNEDKEQTSAYMLMYRKYDDGNILPFLQSQLPQHILDTWDTLMEDDKKAKNDDTLEKNTIKMAVKYKPYKCLETRSEDLVIPKSLTTKQVAHFAFKHFFPDVPDPPSDHIRVCRCDLDLGIIENSFYDEDQYLVYSLKNPPPVAKNEGLILEVRNEDDFFPTYSADDLIFMVLLTNGALEKVDKWEEFHAQRDFTVGELKRNVSLKFKMIEPPLQLALQLANDTVQLLNDDSVLLASVATGRVSRLFVEQIPSPGVHAWVEFLTSFIHIMDYVVEVQQVQDSSGRQFINLNGLDIRLVVPLSPERAETTLPLTTSLNVSDITTDSCSSTDAFSPDSEVSTSLSPPSPETTPKSEASTIPVSELNEALSDGSCSEKLEKGTTTITFTTPTNAANGDWIPCSINLDCRITLSTLSHGLGEILSISEREFSLFYLQENDEIEVTNYNQQVQHLVGKGGIFRVRLCRRLIGDEGRVGVFLLDLNDLTACGNYLGDIILHPEMNLNEAKNAVLEQCLHSMGIMDPDKCRLRKKLASERVSKILRDDAPVREWMPRLHDSELYIQVLTHKAPVLDKDTFSVLVRRWHSNDWILDLPIEFTVYHDHSVEVLDLIFDKVVELTGLSLKCVEIARVEAPFPYCLNPLATQDLEWFSAALPPKKPLYLYNDELVLFVRDNLEIPRQCTAEEESQFRKENESDQYESPPRREVGIKINLNVSKTPETPTPPRR